MRVGFVITSPYQLFHYKRIARHLPASRAYIEVRNEDFGLTTDLVNQHLPVSDTVWVSNSRLAEIDGECDALVCQTPVPLMQFFSKSLVVAQQYSLAKERYQYGVWRAQASLNLMYGRYSVERVAGFAHAVAVGNPLLDELYSSGPTAEAPIDRSADLRVLYMPTYGDLCDKRTVVRALLEQRIDLTVKLHHADVKLGGELRNPAIRIVRSDVDPIELILEHDVVVSDYSGAIYDALAARRPVLLVDMLNERSSDLTRLSEEDRSHSEILDVAGSWKPGNSLIAAYEQAFARICDDRTFGRFLEKYFVNLGCAGKCCADEILALEHGGEPQRFDVSQVREAHRRFILENRKLRAQLLAIQDRSLSARFKRLRAMPPAVAIARVSRWGLMRLPGGPAAVDALRALRSRFQSRIKALRDPAADPLAVLPVRPIDRRKAVLRILEDALQQGGLDYRTCVTASNAYCAVRRADVEKLCKIVNELGRKHPGKVSVWLASGSYFREAQPAEALSLSVLAAYESVIVGVPYTNQLYSVGIRGGVEVIIAEPRDARLVAKRWSVEVPDWTPYFASGGSNAGRRAHRRERRHVLEGEPIDIVYTWVDSADPEWQAARIEWAKRQKIELQAAGNDERYVNRDELKYSLRSVWLYAPFVRHIYIVTAGHHPDWADTANGKVFVVAHEDIFPDKTDLPTFNSHAIEACLHRIPGLSEHFLYFNDDVFLGRETSVDTYFTKAGLMKSRLSPSGFTTVTRPDLSAIPTDWASYNAAQLMLQDFGILFDRRVKHVPMPLKRSLLAEIESRYSQAVARTRSARFRSPEDLSVPSMLAHYYGIATGRAVEWEGMPRESAYVDTGRRDFAIRLKAIQKDRPTFVCLNVTRHTDVSLRRQAALLQQYLDARYPLPSPFEKAPQEALTSDGEIGEIAGESYGAD